MSINPIFQQALKCVIPITRAEIDRDLMTAIQDAHDLLVKRRNETGETSNAELILWNAIQKYGGDGDRFEVIPRIEGTKGSSTN